MAAKKRHRHNQVEAVIHLRRHHPRCPKAIRVELASRIARRLWRPPVTLGFAVGILTEAYARHQFTDYDSLLQTPGMTREEARLIVAPQVRALLDTWRRPSPPGASPPCAGNDFTEAKEMQAEP